MNCDDVMKLCCAAARKRHPKCEAEGDIERNDATAHRPSWLAGVAPGGGWIAAVNVHGRSRVIVRYEAHGMTKGRAAGNLARAMGVALPEVTP